MSHSVVEFSILFSCFGGVHKTTWPTPYIPLFFRWHTSWRSHAQLYVQS